MNISSRVSPHWDFADSALAILAVLFLDWLETDGLAGVLAYNPAGSGGRCGARNSGFADCLLDCIFGLALEIPRRSRGGFTDCPSANGPRILCSGRARFSKSVGARLAVIYWAHSGVYFRRARNRIHHLQSALRRAAFCRIIRAGRSKADSRLSHAGRFEAADIRSGH